MNLYEKIHWKFWGIVAEQIEEDLEDALDAIIYPFLGLTMTAAFWYGAFIVLQGSGPAATLTGGALALLSVLTAFLTAVSFGSAVVYARQRTAPLTIPEVDDGR